MAPRAEAKKIKILKKYFQNRKELQKLDIKHVLHSPKEEKKIKKVFVMDERIDIQITLYIENPLLSKWANRMIFNDCWCSYTLLSLLKKFCHISDGLSST